jgi:hypothetical protein
MGQGNPGAHAHLYDPVASFYVGLAKAYPESWGKKMREDAIVDRRILPVYLFYVISVHFASKIRGDMWAELFHKVADGFSAVKTK